MKSAKRTLVRDPKTGKLLKVLFIPDTHVPYHNETAFQLMLMAMKEWKPDIIIILGDFADFYSVSTFDKDPTRKLNFDDEVDKVNIALSEIQELGAKTVVFIEGNHEFRLQKYLMKKAPEMYRRLQVKKLFKIEERGWIHVPYRKDYKLGKIYLTHDVDAIGRNAAHRAIDVYMHSVITAHTHRMIYVVEADGTGEPILSAQFGWLGDVEQIDYQHRIKAVKSYVLGFGIGYMEEDTGLLFTQPVPIVFGKCLINGKIYKNGTKNTNTVK